MKSKLIALAVIIFVLAGFSTSAQIGEDIAPKQISTSDVVCGARGDCQIAMAINEDDTMIYVVWPERDADNQNTLYIAVSNDEGRTFAEPRAIPLTTSPNTRHPDLGVAGDGSLLMAWTDDRTGNDDILISVSEDDGATWKWDNNGDFFNLSNNEGDSYEPSISVDLDGFVVIAWSDNSVDKEINPNGGRNIFSRITFNPGQAGTNILELLELLETLNISRRLVSSIGPPAVAPTVQFDPRPTGDPTDLPNVFVAWEQAISSDEEILFHSMQSFSPVLVSDPDEFVDSNRPTMAVAELRNPNQIGGIQAVIAWEERSGSQSRILSSGSTVIEIPFTLPGFSKRVLELSDRDEFASNPALTANSIGEFFIAWQSDDLTSSAPTVIKVRFLSNAFSPIIDISERDDARADAINPVVGADMNNVYVSWVEEDRALNRFDIYFAAQNRIGAF